MAVQTSWEPSPEYKEALRMALRPLEKFIHDWLITTFNYARCFIPPYLMVEDSLIRMAVNLYIDFNGSSTILVTMTQQPGEVKVIYHVGYSLSVCQFFMGNQICNIQCDEQSCPFGFNE